MKRILPLAVPYEPCGRPTKVGMPCAHGRGAMTLGDGFGVIWWESPACKTHLTPEERDARQEVEDRISAAQAAIEPACWSWTVPALEDVIEMINAYPEQVRRYLFPDIVAFEEFHDNRCAICGLRSSDLVEDHDHSTGMVRGKLCRGCNAAEGKSVLPLFWKYRARNPAGILGVQLPYTGIGWVDGVPVGGWESQLRCDSDDESVWIDNAVNYLNL